MKFKKLFVGIAVALSLVFAGSAMAKQDPPGQDKDPAGYYEHTVTGEIKYFKNGHPGDPSQWILVQEYEPQCGGDCDDALSLANNGIMIVSPYEVVSNKGMGWGAAGGFLKLEANALATGKDQKFLFFKFPGFAFANVDVNLMMKVCTKVFSNGEQWYTGLPSITYVNSKGILKFEAEALATGGTLLWLSKCPQFTDTSLKGIFSTMAGGYSLAVGPNGSYAITQGEGTTSVALGAFDSDMGYLISYSEIEGFVFVEQDLFVTSYVSKDGMTTFNFGKVTGGEAKAFGDVNIFGIRAKGSVSQEGMAADGYGAFAYGNSSASFEGAKGYVYENRCGIQANVGGLAVVSGYNNIQHNGNSVSISSHQTAFATTGNGGCQLPNGNDQVVY